MGVIVERTENNDGTFLVRIDKVTPEELSYLASLMNSIQLTAGDGDESEEDDVAQPTSVGNACAIPLGGKHAGMTIEDVYQEGGIDALAELLRHDPNFQDPAQKGWIDPEYNINLLIRLYVEITAYIIANCDEIHPYKFVRAFQSLIGIHAEEALKMSEEEAKAFCFENKGKILERLVAGMTDHTDELDFMETEGVINSFYLTHGLNGISILLRQKSKLDAEMYEQLKKYTLILLRYAECIVSFSEFEQAFSPFFPGQKMEAENYHEYVSQLENRIKG